MENGIKTARNSPCLADLTRHKKAQAWLEFLLIYGWAIVAVMIVLFLLALVVFHWPDSGDSSVQASGEVFLSANQTIVLPAEFAAALNEAYRNHTVEFQYCLYGEIRENETLITEIVPAEMIYATATECEANCTIRDEYLGRIHNHISGRCVLSPLDTFGWGESDAPLTAVICGENRFAFFSREDVYQPLRLRIEG